MAMRSEGGVPPRFDELLLASLTGSGERAAIGPSAEWTGAQLLARAGGAAAQLEAAGVTRGRPVIALLESSPRSMAYLVAGVLGDWPPAPLNPRAPLAELGPVAAALGASAVLSEPHVIELAREVAAASGGVPVLQADDPPEVGRDWRGSAGEVAMVLHTSGTTGQARPVPQLMLPLAYRMAAYCQTSGIGRGDLFSGAAPFHHISGAGMALVALGAGAGVASVPRFTMDSWQWVREVRPSHVLVVPSMIEMLLAAGELDAGMKTLIYGASPIRPETLIGMLKVLPETELVQIFGQTEVSPVTALTHEDHLAAAGGRPELLRSVGRPVPGVELRIENPDERGVGEVAMRGRHAMRSAADGWHRLGDLGRISDGLLYLAGRKGDMIIRGGENIHPLEIERVLAGHPAVAEVVVTAAPDRRLGEVPLAVIVPTDPAAPPDPGELRAFAKERLAGFKVPVLWRFAEALPRNSAGKVLRRML